MTKPDPEPYGLAMSRSGVGVGECLTFEDTASGIASATAAGVTAIAVRQRFTETHDFSAADQVFDNLESAISWVKSTYFE